MKRSITHVVGLLAVLLVSAAAQAELKLVVNFEGMSGSPDGQACNGVLGGVLDTQSEGTGNVGLGAIDGSNALQVNGHSSGNLRAAGLSGVTNPIDNGETGIGFFRFMMRSSGKPIRAHMGLIANATDDPITSTSAQDPLTVPAGFKLADDGAGFQIVTTDGATVLKAGLARAQWYNVWMVADHAADTFALYVSEAAGPGTAATLPQAEDLLKEAIPFGIATADPLRGMIFANPSGTGQAERIYVDDIWWDGDQGLAKPTTAKKPNPVAGGADVPRDVILSWTPGPFAAAHNVYFGTSRADVDSAGPANPLGVLASQGQDANTFDPAGRLALGTTYYWRVDEVNAAPDSTVLKGNVWSFTVEPYTYPLPNVTATASSSHNADMEPEKTVDGSGLDAAGLHGTTDTTMWLSSGTAPPPAWIQYEFDQTYKLTEMQVWNSNQSIEAFAGLGARNVTVEYSPDGSTWIPLAGVPEFAQAPGAAGYAANTTVAFGGVAARYVKLTIHSNWGSMPQTGLSEVRFHHVPVRAREPKPAAGQTNVNPNEVALSWRAGREAVSHDLSLSTDRQMVADGTAPVVTLTQAGYDPSPLELGATYYWKVVEVNQVASPSSWESDLWSFSTVEYLVIDDFESYNDEENQGTRIYETWLDGLVNGTTSTVGNWDAPFAERTIIHGGKQAMPLDYNNVNAPFYAGAEREFAPPQDWTSNGADTLSLWVRGNPAAYVDDAGVITMSGAGHDIWDTADDFRFASRSLSGNGSITVKVESLTNTNGWAKAGVMIRQSLDADSKFVYMVVSYSQGVSFGWRPLRAGTPDSVTQAGVAAPQWVKLTRTGDDFTAQYSADGKTWLDVKNTDGTVASATVTMVGPTDIGLCVTSHNTAAATTAVFSGAATTGSVTGAWQVTAIGDDPEPANSPGVFYVTVQDSAGQAATVTHPTAVTTGTWTQWQIPLSSLTGVDAGKVRKLSLGVDNRANPAQGGAGRIYIDDIGFGRPAATEQDSQ